MAGARVRGGAAEAMDSGPATSEAGFVALAALEKSAAVIADAAAILPARLEAAEDARKGAAVRCHITARAAGTCVNRDAAPQPIPAVGFRDTT